MFPAVVSGCPHARPGAVSTAVEHSRASFLTACTRCDDCVKACPTGLLVRAAGGYPEADFSAAACTFCGDCARACATGAIGRDTTAQPWSFGIAISEGCLAAQNVDCRVCGEMCDVTARSGFVRASAARRCPKSTTPPATAAVPALPPVPWWR
jgi:ferredoxin-type protein NapF